MKKVIYLSVFALGPALVACTEKHSQLKDAQPLHALTSATTLTPSTAAASAAAAKRSSKNDVQFFEVNGAQILSSKIGDLNGNGRPDALIVLDPAGAGQVSGEGPSRIVMLLIRDGEGHLQKVAQNDKIVPCKRCGGMAGDPFGYTRIDKEGFTLLTEGGSREHWWNEYTFKYAAANRAWMLERVERGVRDTEKNSVKKITLTTKDFEMVKFDEFDPSTLPQVTLP